MCTKSVHAFQVINIIDLRKYLNSSTFMRKKMRVVSHTIAGTREKGHPDLGGINRSMEVLTARYR